VTVFYMDVRTFTKGGEEFYDRARSRGVLYRRSNPGEIFQRGDKLVVRGEDTLLRRTVEVEADMVVLAVGLESGKGGHEIGQMLKLAYTGDRFLAEAHPKLRPVDTTSDGGGPRQGRRLLGPHSPVVGPGCRGGHHQFHHPGIVLGLRVVRGGMYLRRSEPPPLAGSDDHQ